MFQAFELPYHLSICGQETLLLDWPFKAYVISNICASQFSCFPSFSFSLQMNKSFCVAELITSNFLTHPYHWLIPNFKIYQILFHIKKELRLSDWRLINLFNNKRILLIKFKFNNHGIKHCHSIINHRKYVC